jgi:hypothetical protein
MDTYTTVDEWRDILCTFTITHHFSVESNDVNYRVMVQSERQRKWSSRAYGVRFFYSFSTERRRFQCRRERLKVTRIT